MPSPSSDAIGDVHRVLLVRHHDALLDRESVDAVEPDRQPQLEAELGQMLGAVRRVRAGDFVLVAEPDDAVPGQPHALEQVIEQDHAAERRGQRRDQHAVVAARQHAGDRAGGVAAEAVGDQPLAPRRALARGDRFVLAVARRVNDA